MVHSSNNQNALIDKEPSLFTKEAHVPTPRIWI